MKDTQASPSGECHASVAEEGMTGKKCKRNKPGPFRTWIEEGSRRNKAPKKLNVQEENRAKEQSNRSRRKKPMTKIDPYKKNVFDSIKMIRINTVRDVIEGNGNTYDEIKKPIRLPIFFVEIKKSGKCDGRKKRKIDFAPTAAPRPRPSKRHQIELIEWRNKNNKPKLPTSMHGSQLRSAIKA